MNATLTRAAKALAVSVVTALALTGCIKVDFTLELQSDDTVDGHITYAVAEGTGALMSTDEEQYTDQEAVDSLFGDLSADDYANGALSDYAEGDWVGKTVTFEGETLDGFALDDGSDGITIVREGDEFVVSGPYDSSGELGEAPEGAEMTLSITFPGTVSETNGELSEDGRTVTWDLLAAPESLDARGGAVEGTSLPWLIPALIVAGVLVLGAVVLALVLMRRKPAGETPYVAPAVPETADGATGLDPTPTQSAAPEAVETPAETLAMPIADAHGDNAVNGVDADTSDAAETSDAATTSDEDEPKA